MKKWICWLFCSIFCITSSKTGLYEEFYPAIYEAVKVQQFYEDKENNLAVNGDSFTYNSNFFKEIEKRSDFI